MPVNTKQFREALGKRAQGLSDAEVKARLEHAYRFAGALYEWWSVRKGSGTSTITGRYVYDMVLESERRRSPAYRNPLEPQNLKLKNSEKIYTLPQPDPSLCAAIREHIWKIPKGDLLQS